MSVEKPKVAVGYRTPEAQSSNDLRQGYPGRRPARIPVLQTDDLNPTEYARTTCFAAGYLTVKNAGWRNERPIFDPAKCNGCLKCYMYCPDGAVFKVDADPAVCTSNKTDTSVAVDLDFCKGCGICARCCSTGALTMIPEADARKADAEAAGAKSVAGEGAGAKAGVASVEAGAAAGSNTDVAATSAATSSTTKEGE